MIKTENTALAPDREELLAEAFELLVKLTLEQLSEIMEGLHG